MKWGLPYLYGWDEPYVVNKTIQIMQTGDFNTHFFLYPSLTSYLLLPFYILNYYRMMGNATIANLQDISLLSETGAFHFISHPSFYTVGRLVMCLLAVGCILLIYEIGKRFFNKKVGLLSALILALFTYHRSATITPNMPVAFFVLLSLYFLSVYIKKGQIGYIIFAGLSAGLTIAAKYNSYPIVFPLFIGILLFSKKQFRDIVIILFSSGFGFFLGCPYALLDLKNFLDQTGRELGGYASGAEKGYVGNPGIEQMKFFLNHFKNWINNIFHIKIAWSLSVLGFFGSFISDFKNFLVVFSYPVLYLFYMSQQKTNHIRNMLCMTPFIALSAGIALYYGYRILVSSLNSFKRKKSLKLKINREALFIGCFLILFFWLRSVGIIKDAYIFLKSYKEVRTKVIEYAIHNFPNAKIGISEELMIHSNDYGKITNRRVFNTEKVTTDSLFLENFDYIISSNRYSFAKEKHRAKNLDRIKILENKFPGKNIIMTLGSGPVNLDGFMIDPKINIYKVDTNFLSEEYLKKIQERYLNLSEKELNRYFRNDSLIKNGSFEIWTQEDLEFPDFFLGDNFTADMLTREEKTVKVGQYAVKIKGSNFNLYQDLTNYKKFSGKEVTCFAWIKTDVANTFRIQIYDGIDANYSEMHSGLGKWELLQVNHRVNPNAKFVKIRVLQAERSEKSDPIVFVDGAVLVEGHWQTFEPYKQYLTRNR